MSAFFKNYNHCGSILVGWRSRECAKRILYMVKETQSRCRENALGNTEATAAAQHPGNVWAPTCGLVSCLLNFNSCGSHIEEQMFVIYQLLICTWAVCRCIKCIKQSIMRQLSTSYKPGEWRRRMSPIKQLQ